MARPRIVPLVALVVLGTGGSAGPAAAGPFVLSSSGNQPDVAVDRTGTAHVVWNSPVGDNTSATHYCRVPRRASQCAGESLRRFVPARGDQDFAGPRVFLRGARRVVVLTARCCGAREGPDGELHGSRLYSFVSGNRGARFSRASWIGTLTPDVGAALEAGTVLSLGIAGGGLGLQSAPLGGFSGAESTISPLLPSSGGVGASPKGDIVAFAHSDRSASGARRPDIWLGRLEGDGNPRPVDFRRLGRGVDVTVTSGPRGADVFSRTTGRELRYVVRRVVGGKVRKQVTVSETGFPVFGTAAQDAAGRIHAVWYGDFGLTYRRSTTSGRRFGKPRVLSRQSGFFNLSIGANRRGTAAVVYDSNDDTGRIGGFIFG